MTGIGTASPITITKTMRCVSGEKNKKRIRSFLKMYAPYKVAFN